jgi:allose kinase
MILVADIGGTHIRLGHLVEGIPANAGQTIATETLRVADPIKAMAGHLQSYAQAHRLKPHAAVLGVPVSLNHDLDRVLSSPNIPQIEQLRLGSELEKALGFKVRLERDINLLLLGEYLAGSAQKAHSVLGAFFGTGVGAGFLLNGKPYRGNSVGLELGHIPIRGEGNICVCGNVDCLEAYACGHTLTALSEQSGVPLGELFQRQAQSAILQKALFEFVRDQAYAVATAINLFDPEVMVVGGGVPEMLAFPKEQFRHTVLEHLRRPYPREVVRFEWARLGSKAALYGALAVLEERP